MPDVTLLLSSSKLFNFSNSFFFFLISLSYLIHWYSLSATFFWSIKICSFMKLISLSATEFTCKSLICFLKSSACCYAKLCSDSLSEDKIEIYSWSILFFLVRSFIISISDSLAFEPESILFSISLLSTRFYWRSLICDYNFLLS